MSKQYSYEQIAENFDLWGEYVDPERVITKEAFERMSVAAKVKMQELTFGPEEEADDLE